MIPLVQLEGQEKKTFAFDCSMKYNFCIKSSNKKNKIAPEVFQMRNMREENLFG